MKVLSECLTFNLTDGNRMKTGALNILLTSEERVSSRNVEGQRHVLAVKVEEDAGGNTVTVLLTPRPGFLRESTDPGSSE